MRLVRRILVLAPIAAVWSIVAASHGASPEAMPETIYTRDTKFEIPVDVGGEPGVSELRLYVSRDLGRTWSRQGSRPAGADRFPFEASADGEYWFYVRTADAKGIETPGGAAEPELRVVVDATPPKIQLTAERAADGVVVLRWHVDDGAIAPESLKLTYRTTRDGEERPIVPLRSKQQGDDHDVSGESAWRPTETERLIVRAVIVDRAENSAAAEAEVGPISGSSPVLQPTNEKTAGRSPAIGGHSAASSTATNAVRDPTKPMLVNSLSFELDYDLDAADASSISKVEIWGTRDAGRTWLLLGADDDRRSPCAVSVDREGWYGFSIVVEGPGSPAKAPRNGDTPEIRVGVDLSPPKVRLTTAEPEETGRPCALVVHWEASDEHLGPRAVSLAYSASSQGPWSPLAVGIANTGSQLCEFDPQGPNAAYLRIEVRDDAGNLGSFATTTPVAIEKRPVQFHVAGTTKSGEKQSRPKWFHVLR